MKIDRYLVFILIIAAMVSSCTTSKKLQPNVVITDTGVNSAKPISDSDSLRISYDHLQELKNKKIDFKTFSAKAKVQFEDKNGRQPDANAIIRMEKDSVIWISLSSTFLNIEVARLLITPDSLIIINKLEKTVESYSFQFIREAVQLPLTFPMLQDIIIGNPVFVGDSIISSMVSGNNFLIETGNNFLKNLLTISAENIFLTGSRITNTFDGQVRTASLEYSDYNAFNQILFATYRALKVEDPSKIDLRMSFKEIEFNNELSFPFSIPGNYKIK